MPGISNSLRGRVFGRPAASGERDGKIVCRCECGEERLVRRDNLLSGNSTTCGGHRVRRITHALSKTPLYAVWCTMKARCENPKSKKYKWYGARGITVCERWESFELVFADR